MPAERMISGTFWKPTAGAHGGGGDTQKMKYSPITKQLWHVGGGFVWYSDDFGESWTAGGLPTDCVDCFDVSATRSGVYYGLFVDGDGFLNIAHSSNFTAWVTDFVDDTARTGYNIGASADGSLIAATCGDTRYRAIVSDDFGVTFDVKTLDPELTGGVANQPLVHVAGNRIIIVMQGDPVPPLSPLFEAVWSEDTDNADFTNPNYAEDALLLMEILEDQSGGGDPALPTITSSDLTWTLIRSEIDNYMFGMIPISDRYSYYWATLPQGSPDPVALDILGTGNNALMKIIAIRGVTAVVDDDADIASSAPETISSVLIPTGPSVAFAIGNYASSLDTTTYSPAPQGYVFPPVNLSGVYSSDAGGIFTMTWTGTDLNTGFVLIELG